MAILGSGHNTLVRDQRLPGHRAQDRGVPRPHGVPRRGGHHRLRRGPVHDDPRGGGDRPGRDRGAWSASPRRSGARRHERRHPRRRLSGTSCRRCTFSTPTGPIGELKPAPGLHVPHLRAPDRRILLGVRIQLHRKPQKGDPGRDPGPSQAEEGAPSPSPWRPWAASGRIPTTTRPRSCSRRLDSAASASAAPEISREARQLHPQSWRRYGAGRPRPPRARLRPRAQPDGHPADDGAQDLGRVSLRSTLGGARPGSQ